MSQNENRFHHTIPHVFYYMAKYSIPLFFLPFSISSCWLFPKRNKVKAHNNNTFMLSQALTSQQVSSICLEIFPEGIARAKKIVVEVEVILHYTYITFSTTRQHEKKERENRYKLVYLTILKWNKMKEWEMRYHNLITTTITYAA